MSEHDQSVRAYRDGEVIEYTSFAPGEYSIGQVVRYDDEADPLVYIRTKAGGVPFPVRQSQLRARVRCAHCGEWCRDRFTGEDDPLGRTWCTPEHMDASAEASAEQRYQPGVAT